MKLTIHLPSSDDAAVLECFALPELQLLTASRKSLFIFRKGLERLRDEKRIAPEAQLSIPGVKAGGLAPATRKRFAASDAAVAKRRRERMFEKPARKAKR